MSFVLDNSVALAWCFEDEHTPKILSVLQRVTETGAHAPMLWPLEATNGLLVAERRGRLDMQRRLHLHGFLQALPIALDADTAGHAWGATTRLAEQYGLSAYDAAYLELAERLGLPLASLDRALRNAAAARGRPLLGVDA